MAVVGAGPAGLTAAAELARADVGDVVVIEREADAGGIPRHSNHTGFGLRDINRFVPGPTYARRLTDAARAAGAEIWTSAMVTGWSSDGGLEVTSMRGRATLRADAVVLCTGCRERPRSARLIAGTRPEGVITTGTLQQLVYLKHRTVGRRAVIVGAEHVSFSALATLAHAGASVAALTTELPHHQSYAVFALGARVLYRTPTLTNTKITRIFGDVHVEGVELLDVVTGSVTDVDCDVVVLSGDWIPDSELAVLGRLEVDVASGAPLVDTRARTTRAGVFAAGNVTHPAETADIAALGGRHAAASVIDYLRGERSWPSPAARLVCNGVLHWITPQLIAVDHASPSRNRFVIRWRETVRHASVSVTQGALRLWAGRSRGLMPNRSATLPASWLALVGNTGEPVVILALK